MFKPLTKSMRALGLVVDGFLVGGFIILFLLSSGWEAALNAVFALWCAYDWWVGYNTKVEE